MLATEKIQLGIHQDRLEIITGGTWEDFEQLISEEYLGYRVSYIEGEITLVSPGRKHENTKELTGILIVAFCDFTEINYYCHGSTTLKNPPLAGKEPDISYAIAIEKNAPDIAVEVNYSSGSIRSLEIYKNLGTKEVWMWDKSDKLTFYILEDGQYTEYKQSLILPSLRAEIIEKYVKLMRNDNPRTVKKQFLKEFNKSK